MKCLVLSDTFPNRLEPWRGPYNRRQFECLADHCSVEVVDPLPWPKLLQGTCYWSLPGKIDSVLPGIKICHPVFWYLPLAGRSQSWRGVLRAARKALRKRLQSSYDIVVSTFAYPHGLAAKYLAQELEIPYAVKVRGSDLHSLPKTGKRRCRTAEAIRDAAAVVAVSSNLADIATNLGCPAERVHVLPNGVDADRFRMIPRMQARATLGIEASEKLLLFVGSLRPVKGLDTLIDAFEKLTGHPEIGQSVHLAIAGDGPLRKWLESQVSRRDLEERIRLLGTLSREDVCLWMNAADTVVLPSRNEGCPNVVLESLSCGTPVVASRVGAVPDLLDETCGIQVQPGDSVLLSEAIAVVLGKSWEPIDIHGKVRNQSWQLNSRKFYRILCACTSPNTSTL